MPKCSSQSQCWFSRDFEASHLRVYMDYEIISVVWLSQQSHNEAPAIKN
jgi:hypothetical protein